MSDTPVLKDINLDDAWLGLDPYLDEDQLFNPLDYIYESCEDDSEIFAEKFSWLMTRPEYFSFVCKHILNIDILPLQALLLYDMWNHKFPLLIGSRGLSKALEPDCPVLTPDGWVPIKDLKIGDTVYGSNGKKTKVVSTTHRQKNLKFYKITFRDGRTINACEDHMWKIWSKNKNKNSEDSFENPIWSEMATKELVDSYFYDRKDSKSKSPKRTREYLYAIPICKSIDFDESELPIHPYVLGVLLGDGSMTHKTISFTSSDQEIADRVESLLPVGYKLTRSKKKNHSVYHISRSNKSLKAFRFLLEELGLHGKCSHDKFIPTSYLFSSHNQRMDLLRGLMDTDGTASKGSASYTTVSQKLHDGFMDLVRSLGIHCKGKTYKTFFNGRRYSDHYLTQIYTDVDIFYLPRKNAQINKNKSRSGKSKYTKVFITNIEQIENRDGYCIQVDNEDHTYITKDFIVTHNSFTLAVYCMLRALLLPQRKVVVVGAAFRQSKFLFEYCDLIWNNAPVLRDMCDNKSGCFKDIDRCIIRLNQGTITFLPLGNGEKIRGQRAHDIISDEMGCLVSSTLVQTDRGLIRIADYLKSDAYALLNKDREFETPERIFKTPLTDVYRVTTQNGYSFECSNIHQTMTTNGWKLSKDLTSSDNMVLETNNYFPSEYLEFNGLRIDEKIGWLMGILVSEGTCTNRNFISIKNTDSNLIDGIKDKIDFDWKEYYKEGYTDDRGWNCKESWTLNLNDTNFRDSLYSAGLDYVTSHNKNIPSSILMSPKSVVIEFLSGLFEGDGTAYNYTEKGGSKRVGIAYYSVNKKMLETLQIILLKFMITSSISSRRSDISSNLNYMLSIRGESAYRLYKLINVLKWKNKFEDADFLIKKPYIRIVTKKTTRYYLSTTEGNKSKHLGSFRTEQEAIDYFEEYQRSRNFVFRVKSVEKLDGQQHLYDFYMPKTNSFIGNGFIQHNSIPSEIFETVVTGFAAVSNSPVEKVRERARSRRAKEYNIAILEGEGDSDTNKSNQVILSGTASYDFNHFANYWKKYHAIVSSKGSVKKLEEFFNGQIPKGIDWAQFSVYRIPFELLPEGLMDEEVVMRSKATIHSGIFEMEYGAVFSTDSKGFFKRTLIESCVCNDKRSIVLPSGEVFFEPSMRGNPHKHYVMGIDPASEVDNFSIVVLEVNEDHRRIVYCWTTTRQRFRDALKANLTEEHDFYGYCARKIRTLMKAFNIVEIAIDPQGGGVAVMEALHDVDKLKPGEVALWPKIDQDKPADTDDEPGLHILSVSNFSSASWTAEANHGLRKDMEDKALLFPYFDSVSLGLSLEEDKRFNRSSDTFEDCLMDIEELKNELALIVITITPSGRERWDTPNTRTGKQDKLRKDRYSALLMANDAARRLLVERTGIKYEEDYYKSVGFASKFTDRHTGGGSDYSGPAWFTDGVNNIY